ncbi:MAG: C25 family cysteine peptidase, partial [candidate division Zixibacteria bacterium]|nr:C25 family cysteine peptidase [candidate division Zixibacteria bacterium]
MKYFGKTTLMILLLVSAVYAEESPTLRFDRALLSFDQPAQSYRYVDLEAISVGSSRLAGAITVYVSLAMTESVTSIHYTASIEALAAGAGSPLVAPDVATSESGAYDHIASSVLLERLGLEPVYVDREITTAAGRYARLLVFPVTVDGTGRLWFHRSVDVFVGDRKITAAGLCGPAEIETIPPSDKDRPRFDRSAETAAEYLLITSADLAQALKPLEQYKNATGYKTTIAIIDDILASTSGGDDPERLREYLKTFHCNGGRYVLLVGDETVLPIRYAYHHSVDFTPDLREQMVCDLYFAELASEWNADNDNVWGERDVDLYGLSPELCVGRLPFNRPEEVTAYVEKLIAYETDPGGGDADYLKNVFFFSSDQMRDYTGGGQHYLIGEAFPESSVIDTVDGVEAVSGDDPSPSNPPACELVTTLSDGYGIVNVLAHGRVDGFAVRTAEYNTWPKSYFLSQVEEPSAHGAFTDLAPNGRTSFYYSLACDNGGYDLDQPPMNLPGANMAQILLRLPAAGAVAFVAYSRYGWVSSSHILQKAFFDSLFAHPDLPAIHAMYKSQAANFYF